ncbi:hypothetical protein AGMMS4956_16220 [Bacteroidia bacterium]|nr:hypothetical protein AGMMS4956_16220 [Bacteroidia bacterium]
MINRLLQFIENQHVSVRFFELSIGASNGVIRKAIANSTDIQSKWVAKIVENYPQLSAEWLLIGKGEMLRNAEPDKKKDDVYKAMYSDLQDKYIDLKGKYIDVQDKYADLQQEVKYQQKGDILSELVIV